MANGQKSDEIVLLSDEEYAEEIQHFDTVFGSESFENLQNKLIEFAEDYKSRE